MKKGIALFLAAACLWGTAFAEGMESKQKTGFQSLEAEVELTFQPEKDSDIPRELETFLTELSASYITAEIKLQALQEGAVLRADVVFHTKLPGVLSNGMQSVECWYELDRSAEKPRLTVIEHSREEDIYYTLDIQKIPGCFTAIEELNRILEDIWAQGLQDNGQAGSAGESLVLSSQQSARLLARCSKVFQPGNTEASDENAYQGAKVSVALDKKEQEGRSNLWIQADLSVRQLGLFLDLQNFPDGETRVQVQMNAKVYSNDKLTVNLPQPKEKQMVDANELIDRKLFDADRVTVLYRGEAVQFDAPPQLERGVTMVPIRGVLEAAGVQPEQIQFHGENGTITIQDNDKTIILVLENKTAYVDGREVMLTLAPYLAWERTYVPLRFLSEELGFQVEWMGLDQPDGTCLGGVVRLER